jgi:hypothetical protein
MVHTAHLYVHYGMKVMSAPHDDATVVLDEITDNELVLFCLAEVPVHCRKHLNKGMLAARVPITESRLLNTPAKEACLYPCCIFLLVHCPGLGME